MDADTVVVHRVVEPRRAGGVDQHNASALLVWKALLDAMLVLVLVNIRAVQERVILQAAVRVRVNEEVAHDGGASDGLVVLLPGEDGRLPVGPALDGVQIHPALNQDARVRGVETHALHAPDVLLLVHAGRPALLVDAGVEPDAVVHARRQMARPQRHEGRLHIRLQDHLVAVLVRALDHGHLAERGEVGEPRVAGRGQRRELREVAVDPAGLGAEGEELAVLRPVHVRDLGLRADLDARSSPPSSPPS
mmetsp:Transcript_71393/g.220714  ORF Transcript_71393/g.220714 Transcript_71393/m.220714 type:complete len:249 (-) Transcript_71393:11-757(-)